MRKKRLHFAESFSTLSASIEMTYGPYVNGFEKAEKILQTVYDKNADAKRVIDGVKSEVFSGMPYLQQLVIAPTQRLARYPLLLKEVLKSSSEVHFDYEELTRALEKLTAATTKINADKRVAEDMRRRQFLQSHSNRVVLEDHDFESQVLFVSFQKRRTILTIVLFFR